MAGNAFDREAFNTLEKPSSDDWNRVGSYSDFALRELVNRMLLRRTSAVTGTNFNGNHNDAGFIADGFYAKAVGTNTIYLTAGIGFDRDAADAPTNITAGPAGISGISDLCELKPLVLNADKAVVIDAGHATLPRWDLIEVRYDRRLDDYASKFFLNPTTGVIAGDVVPKTLAWNLDDVTVMSDASTAINYVKGTPNASPVRPAGTTGYLPVCYVYVAATATTFADQGVIADRRNMLYDNGMITIGGSASLSGAGWGMTYAALPPGWRYTYEKDGSDNVTVWLFHPPYVAANFGAGTDDPSTVGAVVSMWPDTMASMQTNAGELVDSTIKTGIAGGYDVSEAIEVCVGQPYTKIYVGVVAGGTNNIGWSLTVPTRL